jgi:DNA primase
VARIPEQVVEEVRTRADIVQIVGRYVTLKESGNRLWGLCPFHEEKTPSFSVHRDRQIFYCFGCEASGDVFAFCMLQSALDFPDVVRSLARELGIEIPEGETGSGERSRALYRANDEALTHFRSELASSRGAPARAYLRARGVSEDMIERFQLGYAPARWDGLVEHLGRNSLRTAEQAGLVAKRKTGDGYYDRFRNRILFPIREPAGNLLGFGGRALGEDETPKYLNSPESPIYRKSRVLFGLPLALEAIRRSGRVVVVEGYFDLVALHRAGFEEGVAPCGTALTTEHAKRLRRYANEVVLLFDGDYAGRRAAERALPVLLEEGLRVRAVFLPLGQDPDDLLESSGTTALRSCVEGAVPLLDTLIDDALARGSDHAWAGADVARELRPYLGAIRDPVERAIYVRRVSGSLEIPPAALERSLRAERVDPPLRPRESAGSRRPTEFDPALLALLGALGAYPQDTMPVVERLQAEWLQDLEGSELIVELAAATRIHGGAAAAQLVTPESEQIGDQLKAALPEILLKNEPNDRVAAERAARDCVAQLGRRWLDRKLRDVRGRLESCSDSEQVAQLLEEQQRYMAQRRELWSQVQQV